MTLFVTESLFGPTLGMEGILIGTLSGREEAVGAGSGIEIGDEVGASPPLSTGAVDELPCETISGSGDG